MAQSVNRSTSQPVAIAILVIIAAAIHFFRASADPDIRILFILNGLGFLALGAGALFVQSPQVQTWSRRILIGYAAVTVGLYLLWTVWDGAWVVPWGPIATLAEIALIWLLVREGRAARNQRP